MDVSRRDILRVAGLGTASAAAASAGCLSAPGSGGTGSEHAPPGNPTAWDETPDCVTSEERDGMDEHYDSTIAVARTRSDLAAGYAPIRYALLSDPERELIDAVTTDGGHSTCDESDAFEAFVGRVRDHLQRQQDAMAYLERDGVYYGLRVEVEDQGVSY